MNDWFFMLGEALSPVERQHARDYLVHLGIVVEYPIEGVGDWRSAYQVIRTPEWDRVVWDAEQNERLRLLEIANAACGEAQVRKALSAVVSACEPAHGTAAVFAASVGCTDVGFIRAAAGAACEAAYLATLASLAGAPAHHAFHAKQSLFAAGHWPLGPVSGRFYIY